MSGKKTLMQEIKNEIEQCDENQRQQLKCAIDVIRKERNCEKDEESLVDEVKI